MAQGQNLDFNIAANVTGMEEIATLINRVGALEKEIKSVSQANAGLNASTNTVVRNGTRYNNVMDAQSKALRNTRMGTQQLGMQINDFATSVSTGASVTQAFNQQIGQVGYAMSMMGGRLGSVGMFLAGPWGAAVTVATMVLSPFIARLLGVGDAADEAKSALDGMIEAQQGIDAERSMVFRGQQELNGLIQQERDLKAEIQRISGGRTQGNTNIPQFAYRQYQELLDLQRRIQAGRQAIFGETVDRRGEVVQRQRAAAARDAAAADSEAARAARDLARDLREQQQELARVRAELRIATSPAEDLRKRLTGLSEAFGQGAVSAAEFRLTVRDALGAPPNGVDLMRTQLEAWRRSLGAGIVTAAEFTDWLANLPVRVSRATQELRALNEELRATNPGTAWDSFALPESVITQAKDRAEEVRDIIRGYTDDMKKSFDSVGESVSDAFQGMVTGAMGWREALRGIINSVISQLWKLYVTQQIVGLVSNAMGSVGMPIPARASGGSVGANQPYMVGERGPELFVPRGNGTIIPNHNMSSGGGATVNVSVDARGAGDPAAVRQQVQMGIAQALPQILSMAEASTRRGLGRPRLAGAMG